ncbi:hypothetical protein B0H16DRAFT_1435411 [Mycena metata]|uniref:F-box domain-containing protein n=1 Tax=Mycena metata TaxID=1033252 RepID=A0AAD7MFB9_9AGAR|nr:hypothetical protein B0H16DRAFT_1435411 [Mycena metata]
MHRCLQLLEIVDMIFSHLYFVPDRDLPRRHAKLRDLAVLARTCTFFSGVALDFLWRSTVLVNLLCCLPSDLWRIDEFEDGNDQMWLVRPVRRADWTRVAMNASRVKDLSFAPDECDTTAVLSTLMLCIPADLLPNLRRLHWGCPGDDFHHIHMFLTLSITSVFFNSSPAALSLLSILPEKCPNLQDIEMRANLDSAEWDSVAEIQAVSSFLCRLQSAESISVPLANRRALEHLCHMPNLKCLGLDTFPSGVTFDSAEGPTFQTLRTLQLHYAALGPATEFLTMFREVSLSSLIACLVPPPTADETQYFFNAVIAAISHSSLTDITIHSDGDTTDLNHYHIRNQSLLTLTCFPNLTSIVIYAFGGFDLDNTVILAMARAWPRLEYLRLARERPSSRPRVTLQCLHSFAQYSPRLGTLAMTFDGTIVPTVDQPVANPVVQQRALTHLDVRHSAIASTPDAIAQFLSRRFPSLRQISPVPRLPQLFPAHLNAERDDATRQFDVLWKEVEELLAVA